MRRRKWSLEFASLPGLSRNPGAVVEPDIPERRSTVLLALFQEGSPTSTLLRAEELARRFDAALHIVRVLPEFTSANILFPQHNLIHAMLAVEQATKADQASRLWIRQSLNSDEIIRRFSIIKGTFAERITTHALEVDAQLIVVPSCARQMRSMVTSLASMAGVPVVITGDVGDETIIVPKIGLSPQS